MVWITTIALKSGLKMYLEKLKKNLPRESGHPFAWTQSPAALALCALAHTTYTIDVPYFNLLYIALCGFKLLQKH